MNSMVRSQDKTDSWFFFLSFTDGSQWYHFNFCNFESTQNLRTCFAEKNKAFKKTCRMQELRKQVPFFRKVVRYGMHQFPVHLRFVFLKQVQDKISPLA